MCSRKCWDANPDIQDLYDHIQAINAEYEEGSAQ